MTTYMSTANIHSASRLRIPMSPDQIRRLNLPRAGMGRRGYSEPHVDALLERLAVDAEHASDINQALRSQLEHAKDALKQWHVDYKKKLGQTNETVTMDAINLMSRVRRQADGLVARAQDYAASVSWDAQHQAETIFAAAQRRAEVEAEQAAQVYRHESGSQYAAEIEEMKRRIAWLQAFTHAVQMQLATAAQAFVDELGRLAEIIPGHR
jgi:DivIVA domain-containing protein